MTVVRREVDVISRNICTKRTTAQIARQDQIPPRGFEREMRNQLNLFSANFTTKQCSRLGMRKVAFNLPVTATAARVLCFIFPQRRMTTKLKHSHNSAVIAVLALICGFGSIVRGFPTTFAPENCPTSKVEREREGKGKKGRENHFTE